MAKVSYSPLAPVLACDQCGQAKLPTVYPTKSLVSQTVTAMDILLYTFFPQQPTNMDPFCSCESVLSNPSQIMARRRTSSECSRGNKACHRLSVTPDVWRRQVFFLEIDTVHVDTQDSRDNSK